MTLSQFRRCKSSEETDIGLSLQSGDRGVEEGGEEELFPPESDFVPAIDRLASLTSRSDEERRGYPHSRVLSRGGTPDGYRGDNESREADFNT